MRKEKEGIRKFHCNYSQNVYVKKWTVLLSRFRFHLALNYSEHYFVIFIEGVGLDRPNFAFKSKERFLGKASLPSWKEGLIVGSLGFEPRACGSEGTSMEKACQKTSFLRRPRCQHSATKSEQRVMHPLSSLGKRGYIQCTS